MVAGNALQRQIANRLIKKIKKEHAGAQGAGGGTGMGTCGTRGLPNSPAGTGRQFGDGFSLFGYFWGREDLRSALPTCWLSTSNSEPRAQEQGQGGSQQHPAGTTLKTGWQRRDLGSFSIFQAPEPCACRSLLRSASRAASATLCPLPAQGWIFQDGFVTPEKSPGWIFF